MNSAAGDSLKVDDYQPWYEQRQKCRGCANVVIREMDSGATVVPVHYCGKPGVFCIEERSAGGACGPDAVLFVAKGA